MTGAADREEPGVYGPTTRIRPYTTLEQNLADMAEGSPGALDVLHRVHAEGGAVDPDSIVGGLGPIMLLDRYGVYGGDIWVLYESLCNSSIVRTIAVLRATQLEIIDGAQLQAQIAGARIAHGEPRHHEVRGGFDVDRACAAVAERLPHFGCDDAGRPLEPDWPPHGSGAGNRSHKEQS